jgi:hypothetical protein
MPFFPLFFLRELCLAHRHQCSPSRRPAPELGIKADLRPALADQPEGTSFAFETLKLIPATVGPIEGEVLGILGLGLLGAGWFLLPFMSRGRAGGPGRGIRIAGTLLLVYAVLMTVKGMLT